MKNIFNPIKENILTDGCFIINYTKIGTLRLTCSYPFIKNNVYIDNYYELTYRSYHRLLNIKYDTVIYSSDILYLC